MSEFALRLGSVLDWNDLPPNGFYNEIALISIAFSFRLKLNCGVCLHSNGVFIFIEWRNEHTKINKTQCKLHIALKRCFRKWKTIKRLYISGWFQSYKSFQPQMNNCCYSKTFSKELLWFRFHIWWGERIKRFRIPSKYVYVSQITNACFPECILIAFAFEIENFHHFISFHFMICVFFSKSKHGICANAINRQTKWRRKSMYCS